ncbi:hypothetical protein FLA_1346 [Filimonas lacunae]|nr:hypothetical protein FLA_1346 [Filimonas lacunae]
MCKEKFIFCANLIRWISRNCPLTLKSPFSQPEKRIENSTEDISK